MRLLEYDKRKAKSLQTITGTGRPGTQSIRVSTEVDPNPHADSNANANADVNVNPVMNPRRNPKPKPKPTPTGRLIETLREILQEILQLQKLGNPLDSWVSPGGQLLRKVREQWEA